ncbi:MAG: beta-carotene 15,15'-dioxygenase, Brp/Blh family [Bdellovibrio sp.]|nr:beta-carotene 15,15'-dioxygenase, Brp/Blh family [Bdellovibrio sp.]
MLMMIYDHVILGAGLSGLPKAEKLLSTIANDARVLILDPDPQNLCHRTFCTWRKKTDLNHPHQHLVSHRYNQFRITSQDQEKGLIKSFDEFVYERIPGDVFYREMHKKIFSDPRFEILITAAKEVTEAKDHVVIKTQDNQKIYAQKVWSSLTQGSPDLIQHFFGLEIETDFDFFDESVVDLMDFRVEQKNEVRFIYILPFSKRIGLVEFTLFSQTLLSADEYEKELRLYLLKKLNLSDFKIRQIEKGAIPMTLDPWPLFSSSLENSHITSIGGAAGQIKASTGYSFIRNQDEQRFNKSPSLFHWRYRVYDVLLISIMKSNGSVISEIFPQLFSQNSSDVLFRFLDEKTSFIEEIQIFYKLPWKNFLQQLILNYPFPFVAGILLLANSTSFVYAGHQVGAIFLWLVPVIGLFSLGISHGSIDHKIEVKLSKLKFYSVYLAGFISFFILWLISPLASLVFFIFLSADHFGENEFLRALKISNDQFRVRILTIVWGLAVSLMAPLFHWEAAKVILQTLLRDSEFGNFLSIDQARIGGLTLAFFALVSAKLLARYEFKALGRRVPVVLSTFFLCFVFWKLPLIPGFLSFFCFWHSWNTIAQQRKFLNWSASHYLKEAAPFTILASLSLVGVVFYSDSLINFWPYLFLFLGALTVSHSIMLKRFYKFKFYFKSKV